MTEARDRRRRDLDLYRGRILAELGYRSASDWKETPVFQNPVAAAVAALFGYRSIAPGLVRR